MANRYSYRPSGYNPTQDQQPPPRADVRPYLTCGVVVMIVLVLGGFIAAMIVNGQKSAHLSGTQTAVALTPTATLTLDSWAMTGTAIFWLTYTPTPTLDVTFTPTSTGTVTPDIPSTMTALYITLRPHMVEVTAEATPEPMARVTAKPASNTYYPPVPSGGNPAPQPTERPQVVIVTRIVSHPVPVPVVITATLRAESTQEPLPIPTALPSATLTASATITPTSSATPSETATSTPSETPTDIPSSTPSETATEVPSPTATDIPTATETPSETPTDSPTEELPA